MWDLLYYILFMSCAAVIFPYSANLLYVLGLFVVLTLLFVKSRIQGNPASAAESTGN